MHSDPSFLISLVTILVASQIVGRVFSVIGQPAVIGEIAAGILLGPSLLGVELSSRVISPASILQLAPVSQIGLILFMFLIGSDLELSHLKEGSRTIVLTSLSSICFPLLLGLPLSLFLFYRYPAGAVALSTFVLFISLALSVTAFPVLARILTDNGISRTSLGVLALSCAAINDIVAWILLAFTAAFANAQLGNVLPIAVGSLLYIGFMGYFGRRLLRFAWTIFSKTGNSRGYLGFLMVALFVSALVADQIGIHAVFGAFLLGVIMPREPEFVRELGRHLEVFVAIVFLPMFFALSGLRTRIDLLAGYQEWLACALIVFTATLGKFGGCYAAGRYSGLNKPDAAALGALMNTRGLMELVVLNVGLDLGIISQRVFAMMVIMALLTTAMAAPVLKATGWSRHAQV